MRKFNNLSISGLTVIYGPYNESNRALFGGSDTKFLKALNRQQMVDNWLIFNGLKMRLAA